MSLLQSIKAAQLQARKSRDAVTAASLTTLIGEAEMVGKNAGRDVNDAEVTALLKKFIKNIDTTLEAVGTSDAEKSAVYSTEKHLYGSFLPKQLSEPEIAMAIEAAITNGAKNVGEAMKYLKLNHTGTYDGATASRLLKARFA